jgi:hypothetical protein
MTVSNGSTLGTASGILAKLAVLAIDNAGTVELAVVNANAYGLLDERSLISTTAEGGTGTADSGTVIYSTIARTSVPFRIVGYVESTQATAGAYVTAPSNIAGMGGAIVPQPTPTITSGTVVSPTSGTGVTFTGIPSWVKRITIMIGGLTYSTSLQTSIQIGSGSLSTSGYTSVGAVIVGAAVGISSQTSGFNTHGAYTGPISGQVVLTLLNSATNLWTASGLISHGQPAMQQTSGYIALAGSLDRVAINTVAGTATLSAGSVNILYE